MEEIKGDASKNVDEALWMVDNFVSHEVTVVSQTTSEEGILGDNSTQNLTQTQDSEAKNKGENTRNEEQNVVCAYKDAIIASNIEEINKSLNKAEDSKFTESSFRSQSPINNQEVKVKETRKEEGNIFTANADTSTISINQEEDKKIYYFQEFENCSPRSVSPDGLVIVETDEFTESELENTANLDTTNGNNSVNVNTLSTSREVSNFPPVSLRSVQKVLPTVNSNVHDKDLKIVDTSTPILNYEHNNNVLVSLNRTLLENESSVLDLSKKVTSTDTADILPVKEQNNDTSDPIGNVANNSTDPNYMYPNGHFSRISNYNRRVGLYNNGATCYINSVMQALLATNEFSTLTVMKMYQQFNEHSCWSMLAKLFGNMMFTIHPIVNPNEFYSKLNPTQFNVFQEGDASEFLFHFLPKLWHCEPKSHLTQPRDLSRSIKAQPSTSADLSYFPDNAVAGCSYQTSEPTPRKLRKVADFNNSRKYIDDLFCSIIAQRITCQVCKNVSNVSEMVRMMYLSFPDMYTHEAIQVQSLLNDNFSTEELTGENGYKCGKCNKRQVALKDTFVVHPAKYLIITLKNFSCDRKVLSKKMQKVHCDENIILQTQTNQKATYTLYAVVVHRGYSLNTGHYTAFTKYGDKWYNNNDKKVSSVEASDINNLNTNETPYILFYKRSDVKEGKFPEYDSIPWLAQYAVKMYDAPQD